MLHRPIDRLNLVGCHRDWSMCPGLFEADPPHISVVTSDHLHAFTAYGLITHNEHMCYIASYVDEVFIIQVLSGTIEAQSTIGHMVHGLVEYQGMYYASTEYGLYVGVIGDEFTWVDRARYKDEHRYTLSGLSHIAVDPHGVLYVVQKSHTRYYLLVIEKLTIKHIIPVDNLTIRGIFHNGVNVHVWGLYRAKFYVQRVVVNYLGMRHGMETILTTNENVLDMATDVATGMIYIVTRRGIFHSNGSNVLRVRASIDQWSSDTTRCLIDADGCIVLKGEVREVVESWVVQ